MKQLEEQTTEVENGGIDVETDSGNRYHIKVDTLEMSMIGMTTISFLQYFKYFDPSCSDYRWQSN